MPQHLLRASHAFELMMMAPRHRPHENRPKLAETGYRFAPESARIYLTNALEPKVKTPNRLRRPRPQRAPRVGSRNQMV